MSCPKEPSVELMNIERHPLEPFLPEGAKILMLGSFPPPRVRWSMEFFYPNFQNDMWRICGLLFYGDKHYFEVAGERRFDRERVEVSAVKRAWLSTIRQWLFVVCAGTPRMPISKW